MNLVNHNTMIPVKHIKQVKKLLNGLEVIVLKGLFNEIRLEGRKKDIDHAIELLVAFNPAKRRKPIARYDIMEDGLAQLNTYGDWAYWDDVKELLIENGLAHLLE